VYYPKVFVYAVYGTGTRAQGEREDADERAAGAVDSARRRAEAAGNIWVDVSQQSKITCACGKALDLDLAHHPRVPQYKGQSAPRKSGVIPFPETPKKPSP